MNLGEEAVCCVIVASYEFHLDKLMIAYMIKNNYMTLLKTIWAFGKNNVIVLDDGDKNLGHDEPVYFSYSDLFKLI